MREIKFRAWDKKDKIMYKENALSLVIHFNGELNSFDGETGEIVGTEYTRKMELMQYTGLKDKNGIKIYEGDIVNCIEYECCGYIGWNDSEAGFYLNVLMEDGRYEEEQLYDYVDELEVIGNIYENPELLNKEEQA